MTGPVRLSVWARPGNTQDGVTWDPWRGRWVIRCRAEPIAGRANEAILGLVAGWLSIPVSEIRWVRAGSSPAKILEIRGLGPEEVERRLRSAGSAETSNPPSSDRRRSIPRAPDREPGDRSGP